MANGPDPEQAMLAEARAEVGIADQKASMLLAALGIGFGAVLAGLLARNWKPSDLKGAGEVLWWVGATLALFSVLSAALAVWPRYRKSDVTAGIFYWGHVATYKKYPDFVNALSNWPVVGLDRVRHQLWNLSRLVDRKYTFIRVAMALAGLAVPFFLLSSAVGA